MSSFPLPEAQLSALFMQSITYGIHMATFAACMYSWFLRRNRSVPANWLWMAVAVALFVVGTCDVAFNFYHNLIAFNFYKGPGGASTVFDHSSNWVNIMRSVWMCLQVVISDAALIYRCWVVYAHSPYQIAVGIICLIAWLACISCQVMFLYFLSTLHADLPLPMIARMQPFLRAYFITTLMVNLLTTSLIVIRLFPVHKQTAAVFTRSRRVRTRLSLAEVTLIIVESALLYTTTIVLSIVLDIVKSNGFYGMSDISLEIAGISFDLIIIRIWTGVSTEQTQAFVDTVQCSSKAKAGSRKAVVSVHSAQSDLTDLNVLELQAVVSPDDDAEWQVKTESAAEQSGAERF